MAADAPSSPGVVVGYSQATPRPLGSGPGPVAPITARQRKQVYLQSGIFDSRGVPPQSVYVKSRQTTLLGQVQQQLLRTPPKDQASSAQMLPSAADLKATANQGHGVIAWDTPTPERSRQATGSASPQNADAQFVQFGESGDHIKVVKANKDSTSIQREFATLDWADTRCETMRPQDRSQRSRLDASGRKMQDMSSEVLGSNRRLEKSTACPSKEIRSVPMLNVHGVDSAIDRQCDMERSPGRGTSEEVQAQSRQQPQQDNVAPLSARERRKCNLGVSQSSQFLGPRSRSGDLHVGSQSARRTEEVGRRRQERNFSDIFGPVAEGSPVPVSSPPLYREVAEGTRAAGVSDSTSVEAVIYRPHVSARQQPKDPQQESVLPVTPRVERKEGSPKVTKVQNEERACWDTRVGMALGAEIARRHRDRLARQDSDATSFNKSASERKLLEMGSRNLRCGMGGSPSPAEDEYRAPTRVTDFRQHAASASPIGKGGGSYKNMNSHISETARARNLQSNVIF